MDLSLILLFFVVVIRLTLGLSVCIPDGKTNNFPNLLFFLRPSSWDSSTSWGSMGGLLSGNTTVPSSIPSSDQDKRDPSQVVCSWKPSLPGISLPTEWGVYEIKSSGQPEPVSLLPDHTLGALGPGISWSYCPESVTQSVDLAQCVCSCVCTSWPERWPGHIWGWGLLLDYRVNRASWLVG